MSGEMGKGMKTLVIIPAYNEQENILHTLEDLREHCAWADPLVVNDCSTDRTEEVLQENGVRYVTLPVNLGIGGAVQTGYRYAMEQGYDIAIQFDGDGQHEARYLAQLAEPLRNGEADIVIGSRFLEKEGFQSSGIRRIGIRFLSFLIRCLTGIRVLDVTSGLRAVNRRMIKEYAEDYAQDYPEPEAILHAGVRGAVIREVPVQMRERENGKSSINAMHSAYYMIKVSIALLIGKISRG